MKPDTLGFGDPVPLCTPPGAQRSLFDPGLPARDPRGHRDQPPAQRPRACSSCCSRTAGRGGRRLAIGGAAAILLIAAFNLAHFSQGWVQWGYRFSLDFMPFVLPLVALGAARDDGRLRTLAYALVVAGAAVNLWGVTWGKLLGW